MHVYTNKFKVSEVKVNCVEIVPLMCVIAFTANAEQHIAQNHITTYQSHNTMQDLTISNRELHLLKLGHDILISSFVSIL